jgi:hypothetical protein
MTISKVTVGDRVRISSELFMYPGEVGTVKKPVYDGADGFMVVRLDLKRNGRHVVTKVHHLNLTKVE